MRLDAQTQLSFEIGHILLSPYVARQLGSVEQAEVARSNGDILAARTAIDDGNRLCPVCEMLGPDLTSPDLLDAPAGDAECVLVHCQHFAVHQQGGGVPIQLADVAADH